MAVAVAAQGEVVAKVAVAVAVQGEEEEGMGVLASALALEWVWVPVLGMAQVKELVWVLVARALLRRGRRIPLGRRRIRRTTGHRHNLRCNPKTPRSKF